MLGVGRRASQAEIKKAYHTLAARYHPDRHQGNPLEELAREKLAQANEAYRVLENPDLRRAYDTTRGGFGPAGDPVTASAAQAPGRAPSRSAPLQSWTGLLVVLALIVALPLLLRVFRNPRTLAVVGLILALAWFGPRIWRYFRK